LSFFISKTFNQKKEFKYLDKNKEFVEVDVVVSDWREKFLFSF
jgi:hypothetical protein